jgi:GTP cyclohydrolase I
MYENLFYGYQKKIVVMDEKTRNGELENGIIPITIFKNESKDMLIRNTKFHSFCEHHMVGFSGTAYVGIIPNKHLLGMNKIDKIVKYFGARLQIQERMTTQIADWIDTNIKPHGVVVVIKANHQCAELQGDNGDFTTSTVRGYFKDNQATKDEFLKLIDLK